MGHALKVPSVDFSSVAVGTVTYNSSVPCTGISLNTGVLSFDTAEQTSQLTATLSPSDTTDSVYWASSNTNVATVSNTGLVTIHGIGTATITATCGSYSASATITQTSLKAPYALYIASGNSASEYNSVLTMTSSTAQGVVGQAYHSDNTDLHMGGTAQASGVEMVRVPYGATAAKIATNTGSAISINYSFICDAENLTLYGGEYYCATYVSRTTFLSSDTGIACQYGQCVAFALVNDSLAALDYIYFT